MNCLADSVLTRYLIEPSTLSSRRRDRIEEHLESCSSCRSTCEYLRDFYEEWENLKSLDGDRLQSFVDELLE